MSYDYTKLNIGKLDYDGIKTNLVNFLRSQKSFENFDFDNPASSVNLFLDILAANTAYNGYYLNSVLTNAFPTTAKTKRSLLLNAALSGTFIPDAKSAQCVATVRNSLATTIEPFSAFTAVTTANDTCTFYNLEPIPPTSGTNTTSIKLIAGKSVKQFSNFDSVNKVIEIPITYDPDSFVLQVQELVNGSYQYVTWTKLTKYSNNSVESANGKVYSVKNGPGVYYVTTNIPGAIAPSGAVRVIAVEVLGTESNNAEITGYRDSTGITVVSSTIPLGAKNSLSKDFIRSYFSYNSNTRDRIVTQDDYIEAIYQFTLDKNLSISKSSIVVNSNSPGVVKVFIPELKDPALQTELITSYLASRKIIGITIEYGEK